MVGIWQKVRVGLSSYDSRHSRGGNTSLLDAGEQRSDQYSEEPKNPGESGRLAGPSRNTIDSLRAAAQFGDVKAMIELADILYCGQDRSTEDIEEATNLLLRAADRGDTEGMHRYAIVVSDRHRNQDESVSEADLTNAFKLNRKAAKSGHPGAQYLMGRFYRDGMGCNKDPGEASRWISISATNGYVPG